MNTYIVLTQLMFPFPEWLWEGWSFTTRITIAEA